MAGGALILDGWWSVGGGAQWQSLPSVASQAGSNEPKVFIQTPHGKRSMESPTASVEGLMLVINGREPLVF